MTDGELRTILGSNIRKYRGLRQMTQADFAHKINLSIPFLSDIENGKKWASARTIAKIADVLAVAAYELFKPENILPDNISDVFAQYTDETHDGIVRLLDSLRRKFQTQMQNTHL
jgi:transcriptional regulator with XRE-family HTH domain